MAVLAAAAVLVVAIRRRVRTTASTPDTVPAGTTEDAALRARLERELEDLYRD